VDEQAYGLLQRFAPTRKDYGRFVGALLRAYEQQQLHDDLRERVKRLEQHIGIPHEPEGVASGQQP
jgi:hypothetical protein